PSEVVTAALRAPANVSLPAISGTAQEGQTLSADPGTWTEAPTGYTYAWRRCSATRSGYRPIGDATTPTYTAGEADVGHTLRVSVVASNQAGSSAPAASPKTAVVTATAQPPANVSPPAISGTAQEGQTLSADPGSWTEAPTGYTYAWRRCSAT